MNNTIILNGLAWDKENLSVDGNIYFTYEEAKAEAAKRGKRLPTKNEFEKLLSLPHMWNNDRIGICFAEKDEDLKNGKSLFLSAAGLRYNGDIMIKDAGEFGYYWSATPYGTIGAYYLSFNSTIAYTNGNNRNYGFTVRCVSDINKSEIMKTDQEIEFKIPEGYAIDDNKSTKTKIVCKPIEPKCPKSFEDAFAGNTISGYQVFSDRIWVAGGQYSKGCSKHIFKTEKQALSALAYAQLTQLMALSCYNGDWTPNWDDPNQDKYCITRMKYEIVKLDYRRYFSFLAFKSEKVRDEFFNNHMDLIKQFHQL